MKIMEVCGTHTAAILKNGIRGIIPPDIQLVSGPGCPVCVTSEAVIDQLIEAAFTPGYRVLSFGDMFKVAGTESSLAQAKAGGAAVEMIYSPLDAVEIAKSETDTTFVIAAAGFETTAPVFAVLLKKLIDNNIRNVKFVTALKTMPPALEFINKFEDVDAFICPGHVAVIVGAEPFRRLNKPCVIAGFEGEHILAAIYELAAQVKQNRAEVVNLYPSVVTGSPQPKAAEVVARFFEPGDAEWRGIGTLKNSGLYLRAEYAEFDYGSRFEESPQTANPCRCGDVLLGRIRPDECPLFGKGCNPEHAAGACMVSAEGACANHYNLGNLGDFR
ncbi:hydrogenase formation protein HypD [Clostridia bacterium]|nr:hydrogenase formation protein HypD [Clostridia bacterium]